MNCFGFSFKSQAGAIALLPMIMVLGFSAMMVFGYLSISQNVLARMNSKREAEQTIDNVINRVSSLMAIRDGTSCDAGIMNSILNIRNLSRTTASVFKKSFIATTSPTLLPIGCVLEADEATKLVRISINFVSLPSDQDLQQLSRTVKITVTGQSTRFANNITVERLMRIRVANLAQHALILWGTAKQKIDLDTSATLEVDGTTFIAAADPNTPFTLTGFVSGLGLPYNGAAIFKKSVFTNSIYASTGADALLQKQLVSVFNQGLQTNFMSDVPLPIFSGSAPIYSGVDTIWQNDIDYEYVFNGERMAPLPAYPGYTSMNDPGHMYTSSGAGTKLPNKNITENLTDTCRGLDDDQGSIAAMVFLQKDKNVVLDFTKSIEDAGPTGNDAFCGLIMAKTLTVRMRKDTRIYGHFVVGKLKVEGTGNLQVVDPESASDIILPGVGHGFDLLRRQLLGLQVFIGQPFYVPLAYDPTTTFASFANFVPQPIYKAMDPGLNPTWPASIDSPVRSNDPDKQTDAYKLFKSGLGQQNLVFTSEVIL